MLQLHSAMSKVNFDGDGDGDVSLELVEALTTCNSYRLINISTESTLSLEIYIYRIASSVKPEDPMVFGQARIFCTNDTAGAVKHKPFGW
jgi:hypothetical protein